MQNYVLKFLKSYDEPYLQSFDLIKDVIEKKESLYVDIWSVWVVIKNILIKLNLLVDLS